MRKCIPFKWKGKIYYEKEMMYTILGNAIVVNRVSWTPVVFDDEKDPCFMRTSHVKKHKNIK